MQQRAGMHMSILMQHHMLQLGRQVIRRALVQALLEAARRLVEQRPGVLLADVRVERLQDLLQRQAVRGVQAHLRARAAGTPLAHHHASPPRPDSYLKSTALFLRHQITEVIGSLLP